MNRPSWLSLSNILAVVALGAVTYQATVREKATRHMILRRSVLDMVTWRDTHLNMFRPEVGFITFLTSGYSIKFDSVSYEADGLRLVGEIGNPKVLQITSLTLRFRVDHSFRADSALFMRSADWAVLAESLKVSTAEVSVGTVMSGSTTPFKVVLPNVKQDGQEYDFTVAFAGERYSYLN